MQLTTMSIRHKAETPTVERDGKMEPNVMVAFLNELASVLGFEKHAVGRSESTLRTLSEECHHTVDTVDAIHVYCDVIVMVGMLSYP